MPIIHTPYQCEPYPYSNDQWDVESAQELRRKLDEQAHDDNTACVVIGAGSLPFTLDVLPRNVYVCDLSPSVTSSVQERCSRLSRADSWDTYRHQLPNTLAAKRELRVAVESGLAGYFPDVLTALNTAQIQLVVGNIALKAVSIGKSMVEQGQKVAFVNFTNVAKYLGRPTVQRILGTPRPTGRAVLADILNTLPMTGDAIICDSHLRRQPALYTLQSYIEAFSYHKPMTPQS